jgi:hypothetical protein
MPPFSHAEAEKAVAAALNKKLSDVFVHSGRRLPPPLLAARDLDLPKLGRTLIHTFLRHALRDGFFHADMHSGNLFVD